MDGLAEDEFCRFRPPKSVQEEDSLLAQSKPKSARYKDKWAVEVFVLLFLIDFQTSKHTVFHRGIKVHPCDLNAGTQLVYHLMNYQLV